MNHPDRALTAANIKYLIAIEEQTLCGAAGSVRCTQIALALGVTKPSVYTMVHTLSQFGALRWAQRGRVLLTPYGRQIAGRYRLGCAQLCRDLGAVLGLDEQECRDAACAVLAQLSQSSLDALLARQAPDCTG